MKGTWIALGLVLGACAGAYQGEPVDLKKQTQPDVVETQSVPPAAPVVAPAGPATRSPWRAWIPRQVQPNGDVIEGHYLEIAPTAPGAEVLQPAKVLPRAPLITYQAKPQTPGAPAGAPPAAMPPPPRSVPMPPSMAPMLPQQWPGVPGQARPGLPLLPSPMTSPLPGSE